MRQMSGVPLERLRQGEERHDHRLDEAAPGGCDRRHLLCLRRWQVEMQRLDFDIAVPVSHLPGM